MFKDHHDKKNLIYVLKKLENYEFGIFEAVLLENFSTSNKTTNEGKQLKYLYEKSKED